MNLAVALFSAIDTIFTLWNKKESRKYVDEYLKLRQRYYEESNQDDEYIDHAVIDNIEQRLLLLNSIIRREVENSRTKARK